MLTRSPLQVRPLRVAGQSLDERINALGSEHVAAYVAGGVFAVTFAALEWLRWLHPFTNPVGITVAAVGMVAWAGWKVWRVRRTVLRLRLARDGERSVAETLDSLRDLGYRVLHDVPAPSFNLDHVLVGPQGIFLIETKTFSKPVARNARIEYDGTRVTIEGRPPGRDPVQQAMASARWLAELLEEMAGRRCFVRPVVLFPGWYVDHSRRTGPAVVWVLNPKGLEGFIEQEPTRLSPEDVNVIAFHLSQYARGAAVVALR